MSNYSALSGLSSGRITYSDGIVRFGAIQFEAVNEDLLVNRLKLAIMLVGLNVTTPRKIECLVEGTLRPFCLVDEACDKLARQQRKLETSNVLIIDGSARGDVVALTAEDPVTRAALVYGEVVVIYPNYSAGRPWWTLKALGDEMKPSSLTDLDETLSKELREIYADMAAAYVRFKETDAAS